MTALLDFTEVGEIRVYLDSNFVHKREKQLARGGLVPGNELATAFSSLRANDLVWSYVVNNYLKGKQPPAFDIVLPVGISFYTFATMSYTLDVYLRRA